ncbi:MAG TPA: hypothetical protein PLK28_06335 [Candidatus Rifleibacterium sp.]|nr:hypothetical protein [Candidatus Rifleibacterium sp.]
MNEAILAFKRKDFPDYWLGDKFALSLSREQFIEQMVSGKACFVDRARAENNHDFKQIIPYILLADSENRLATYSRNGSEKRLAGRMSLGIGGHLRSEDFTDGRFSWPELFSKALQRELLEELPGFMPPADPEFLGIINEEQSSVGRVHIGMVFVIRGIGAADVVAGEELGSLDWVAVSELTSMKGSGFELWSWLALQLFDLKNRPF